MSSSEAEPALSRAFAKCSRRALVVLARRRVTFWRGAHARSMHVLAGALALSWVAGAGATEPPAQAPLKLSVALGPAYALGKAARSWAQRIADATGGASKVQLFAGATLAQRDPRHEFAVLVRGDADLAVGSTLFWSEDVPPLAVASLPWIAPTPRQLAALATGAVAERLAASIEAAGAVALAIGPLPHRELAARADRVHVPADLAGMRVRVAASRLLEDFYATLGAQPVVESAARARDALAAGTLDAQDGTPLAFLASRAPATGLVFVTLWGAVGELAVFAVNRRTWDGWNAEQRAAVRAAARAAATELQTVAAKESESALEALRQRGATVTRLLPPAQAGFAAAAAALTERWKDRVGTDLLGAARAASAAATP